MSPSGSPSLLCSHLTSFSAFTLPSSVYLHVPCTVRLPSWYTNALLIHVENARHPVRPSSQLIFFHMPLKTIALNITLCAFLLSTVISYFSPPLL